MKNLASLAIAVLALVGCTETTAAELVTLKAIRADRVAEGSRVTLSACIGIPFTSNPQEERGLFLIYPCGAELEDSAAEQSIFGRFDSDAVVQPFKKANIKFLGEVSAEIEGVVGWYTDPREGRRYHLLTIDRVRNPSERER